MSLPPIPKLTPATFRWHTCPSDPRIVQRLANGTEALVGIKHENAKGQYDNYLNTTLRIGNISSLCLAGLKENLAAALIHLHLPQQSVSSAQSYQTSSAFLNDQSFASRPVSPNIEPRRTC